MSSLLSRLAPAFADLAIEDGLDGKIIVDVGCGFGRWGHLIRSQVDEGGNQAYVIGCDLFPEYLQKVKKYNPYDELVVCDLRWLPFKEQSVDLLIAFEIIEHLKKPEAIESITAINDICKDRIVISTPLGFMSQPEIRGNKYELHQSAWIADDFKKMGFDVNYYGFGLGIEKICKRLRINDPLCSLLYKIYPKKWSGIQIGAEKKLPHKSKIRNA